MGGFNDIDKIFHDRQGHSINKPYTIKSKYNCGTVNSPFLQIKTRIEYLVIFFLFYLFFTQVRNSKMGQSRTSILIDV